MTERFSFLDYGQFYEGSVQSVSLTPMHANFNFLYNTTFGEKCAMFLVEFTC